MINVDGQTLFFEYVPPVAARVVQWQNGAGQLEYHDVSQNVSFGQDRYAELVEPFVSLWEAEKARLLEEAGRPPTPEEITREFSARVQQRLDEFAQTEVEVMPGVVYSMYDDIRSAISYANDPDPVFSLEGRYALEARSATWSAANAVLAAVMTGQRDAPAWEEVEAELPVLAWPEGSRGHAG